MAGGGKIKDATAQPEDVMQGKIFYNNEGRKIGAYDLSNIPSVLKTYNSNHSGNAGQYSTILDARLAITYDAASSKILYIKESDKNTVYYDNHTVLTGMNFVQYIEYNGTRFWVNFGTNSEFMYYVNLGSTLGSGEVQVIIKGYDVYFRHPYTQNNSSGSNIKIYFTTNG